MNSSRTRGLAIATTLIDGLLAGGNVNRYVVEAPAFRRLGVEAWAAYSRRADLGRNAMNKADVMALESGPHGRNTRRRTNA